MKNKSMHALITEFEKSTALLSDDDKNTLIKRLISRSKFDISIIYNNVTLMQSACIDNSIYPIKNHLFSFGQLPESESMSGDEWYNYHAIVYDSKTQTLSKYDGGDYLKYCKTGK